MRRSQFLFGLLGGLLALAAGSPACKSNAVQQPTLTVSRVEPVFTESKGFLARVHGQAHNPNPFPLPVRRVESQIIVAGQNAAGVQSTSLPTLAANADTPIALDVIVPWPQLSLLSSRAVGVDPVPYTVKGKAWVGTDAAEFPFPFEQSGSLKKADLIRAALKFVPLDIEGLRRHIGDRKP